MILAAALISISVIVRSDVVARGAAQAAEYAARADVAARFLHTAAKPPPPVTLPVAATIWIKGKGGDRWNEVAHFAPDSDLGIVAVLKDGNGTRMPVTDIEMSVQRGSSTSVRLWAPLFADLFEPGCRGFRGYAA